MTGSPATRGTAPLVVAALLALAPMLLSRVPPLYDYPSHLARVDIIHHLLTDGRFAQMYKLNLAVIPNLGIDAFVLPLTFLGVPVEIAGRIFVAVVALAFCFSVIALHRTLFGRASIVPLAAFVYLYNETFMFGFVNYLTGISLALFAFAHWMRLRERRFLIAVALATAWTVGIFFVHLLGALLLFGLVLSYEITEAVLIRMRAEGADRHVRSAALWNLLRRMAIFALPLVCLVLLYKLTPLSGVSSGEAVKDAITSPLQDLPNRVRRLLHKWTVIGHASTKRWRCFLSVVSPLRQSHAGFVSTSGCFLPLWGSWRSMLWRHRTGPT